MIHSDFVVVRSLKYGSALSFTMLFKRKKKIKPDIRLFGVDCKIDINSSDNVITVVLFPFDSDFFERSDSKMIDQHLHKKKIRFEKITALTKVGNVPVVKGYILNLDSKEMLKQEMVKRIL